MFSSGGCSHLLCPRVLPALRVGSSGGAAGAAAYLWEMAEGHGNGARRARRADRRAAPPAARPARRIPVLGEEGELIYVGKARSISKRVASHFGGGEPRVHSRIDRAIDFLVTENEAEALLAEQNSSNATARASTSGCATTSPIPTSASASTRTTRASTSPARATAPDGLLRPLLSAKRLRETLDLLGKLFQYRTCEGPEPGRRSGSPCLDYYIKRCGAPCVGHVSQEEYRRNIDAIIDFLSGRYREVEHEQEEKMAEAAGARGIRAGGDLPRPAESDPLAVRAPARRRRHGRHRRPDRGRGRGRRRQRPGLPGPRRHPRRAPELLPRQRRRTRPREVTEEFIAQYYSASPSMPRTIIVGPYLRERPS